MKFNIGNSVIVTKRGLDSFGMIGVITDISVHGYPNSVLVKFDMWNGEQKEKTLILNRVNLKLESEGVNMTKLTGFKAVAVIEQGYRDYRYAIYDDGTYYQVGDKVFVSGNKEIQTIKEIITPEEASQRFNKNITAEVIGKIDIISYDRRIAKRKEAEELKKSMDKIIKEMDEVNKYEMYAKQNPELAEVLNKYKALVS